MRLVKFVTVLRMQITLSFGKRTKLPLGIVQLWYKSMKQKLYNFTTNVLKAYLSTHSSS